MVIMLEISAKCINFNLWLLKDISYAKYINFSCSHGSQVLATNNLQHAKPNAIKWQLDKFDLAGN